MNFPTRALVATGAVAGAVIGGFVFVSSVGPGTKSDPAEIAASVPSDQITPQSVLLEIESLGVPLSKGPDPLSTWRANLTAGRST